jgi:cell division protein ZapA (FtsZ GTPase activity inhibitor)
VRLGLESSRNAASEAQYESEETMDENNGTAEAIEATERLQAAAERLEKTVAWLEERQAAMTGDVAKIVATVDATADMRQRELERKLEEAEQQIAELKAQAAATSSGRKTIPMSTMQLLAKQGIGSVDGLEAGSLDAALTGLTLEQRVAVKAQLIRAGALG